MNTLSQSFSALIEEEQEEITILANAAAFLHEALLDVSWTGFYLVKNSKLLLGPFQGKTACTSIGFSQGVCGACATMQKTVIVENVHEFPGHIACDASSNSEIVVPILIHDQLYGVLDIDSTSYNRFHQSEQNFLEECMSILSSKLAQIHLIYFQEA